MKLGARPAGLAHCCPAQCVVTCGMSRWTRASLRAGSRLDSFVASAVKVIVVETQRGPGILRSRSAGARLRASTHKGLPRKPVPPALLTRRPLSACFQPLPSCTAQHCTTFAPHHAVHPSQEERKTTSGRKGDGGGRSPSSTTSGRKTAASSTPSTPGGSPPGTASSRPPPPPRWPHQTLDKQQKQQQRRTGGAKGAAGAAAAGGGGGSGSQLGDLVRRNPLLRRFSDGTLLLGDCVMILATEVGGGGAAVWAGGGGL